MLRLWNLALVIMTFSLTLFGTFLTRSGVIASVHAFTQGSIGVFFLSFLGLVLVLALILLAWRWEALGAQGELDSVISRESAFLLNNVLLVAATFTVFFGTVFPLLSEAMRGVKVSVGAPFFNQVNVPLFLGLLFLMGIGPLIAWRRASLDNLKRNFLWPIAVGIAAAAVFRLVGVRSMIAVLSLTLTVFVADRRPSSRPPRRRVSSSPFARPPNRRDGRWKVFRPRKVHGPARRSHCGRRSRDARAVAHGRAAARRARRAAPAPQSPLRWLRRASRHPRRRHRRHGLAGVVGADGDDAAPRGVDGARRLSRALRRPRRQRGVQPRQGHRHVHGGQRSRRAGRAAAGEEVLSTGTVADRLRGLSAGTA